MNSRAVLIPAVLTAVLATVLPAVTAEAETDPPVVLAVQPDRRATGVDPATNVSIDFSEAMDPATVTTTSITLVEGGGTTPLPATVSYDVLLHRATLDPGSPLLATTTYTAAVRGVPVGCAMPLATPSPPTRSGPSPPPAHPTPSPRPSTPRRPAGRNVGAIHHPHRLGTRRHPRDD